MIGRIVISLMLVSALVAGGAIYYLQVYGFYEDVSAEAQVQLTGIVSGEPEAILFEDFRAIDAESSPIRYRACFTTPMSLPLLTETYALYEGAEPRNAPDWFDCFDAEAIGAKIADGSALVFLSEANREFGIDRVVAITDDGQGYVWHEINDCGDKAYDGTPLGEDCPDR